MTNPKNCRECVKTNFCKAAHYGDHRCTEVKNSDYYRMKDARERIKRSREVSKE